MPARRDATAKRRFPRGGLVSALVFHLLVLISLGFALQQTRRGPGD